MCLVPRPSDSVSRKSLIAWHFEISRDGNLFSEFLAIVLPTRIGGLVTEMSLVPYSHPAHTSQCRSTTTLRTGTFIRNKYQHQHQHQDQDQHQHQHQHQQYCPRVVCTTAAGELLRVRRFSCCSWSNDLTVGAHLCVCRHRSKAWVGTWIKILYRHHFIHLN